MLDFSARQRSLGIKFTDPVELGMDRDGLARLSKMIANTGLNVAVAFESTGVYCKSLERYLLNSKTRYVIVPPPASHAQAQTHLHRKKSDPLDCAVIAETYFKNDSLAIQGGDPKDFSDEGFWESGKAMRREYERRMSLLKVAKTQFRARLDLIWTCLDSNMDGITLYSPAVMGILVLFPHPDRILGAGNRKAAAKKYGCTVNMALKAFEKAQSFAWKCHPGVDEASPEVAGFAKLCNEVTGIDESCQSLLKDIIRPAAKVPWHSHCESVVGIGANLASQIIFEISDIKRFPNREKPCAYTGLDPKIKESGECHPGRLRISKHGNKHLRSLPCLAAECNYRQGKDDPIRLFNQKKRRRATYPMSETAANTATAHKILNILYALASNGQDYRY